MGIINWFKPIIAIRMWAFPAAFCVVAIIIAQFSYPVFHTLIELFPVMIAFVMFTVAWTTFDFSKNLFLLFLACGYVWIGLVDLLHLFSFKGVDLFKMGPDDATIQFWVVARYCEAFLLLAAPFLASRDYGKNKLVIGFGLISIILIMLVFSNSMPLAYVEGTGLTPYKIYSEYIIDFILLMALFTFFFFEKGISQRERVLISASIVLTMCAELSFTFYTDIHGFANLVGHIFKLFSFWFIFRAIIYSDLKAPYRALLNSQEKLKSTLKDIKDQKYVLDHHALVVITDPSASIVYVNDKFCKVSGYSREELINNDPRLLRSGIHPKSFYEDMWNTITSGNIWNGEICNKAKDGSLYWLETTIAPLTNEEGEIVQYIAIRTDVSDRKRTEEQLRQVHKMKAVGQLTGGIAHDFNNILGIIMGNLEILSVMVKDNAPAMKRVSSAKKGVTRGSELTKNLLRFSRTTSFDAELVSVNQSIEYIEDLMEKSLTVSITIKKQLSENLWPVKLNKGDLEDTILNLAINARDAMPDGGSIKIETMNAVLKKSDVAELPESKTGEFVMISFSDTGSGMSQEVKEQILEPFFTTKGPNEGTGLGLSMVHGFVQRSGGFMDIQSEVGEGSVFKIYIPKSDGSISTVVSNIDDTEKSLPKGNEAILVVDDEKALLNLTKIQLQELGYSVMTTSEPSKALTILKGKKKIDLMLSDVVMPGDIDGYQLAIAALQERPAIKVLLTSGYPKNQEKYLEEDTKEYVELSEHLLKKPFSKSDLAKAIRSALDKYGNGD